MRRRPRVVAIIQARMGSERLPGKMTLEFGGKTVIERVIERAAAIPGVHQVVAAIPAGKADLPLADAARRSGKAAVFAGSERDVLDRFYRAARAFKADVIVRLTGDCPLLDPEVAGRVVRALLEQGADYASNVCPPSYPDGLDTEAFTFDALSRSRALVRSPSEREHVTVGITNHPERFRQVNVAHGRDLSSMRWVLDQPEDAAFLAALLAKAEARGRRGLPGLEDILRILERNPEIARLNARIKPNEGYYASILRNPPVRPRRLRLARATAPWKKARGCRVWDADGNEYIDASMDGGAVILGHGDPDVEAAAAAQLRKGPALSRPDSIEREAARALREIVPCGETALFAGTVPDALDAAARLARQCTGRDALVVCGTPGRGCRRTGTALFSYNDAESLDRALRRLRGRAAAVIMEPAGLVEPEHGFLEEAARLARRAGALLVFDETSTCVRLAPGGAQERYGVVPDLACLGRAIANGHALAAVVGRARRMRRLDGMLPPGPGPERAASLAACVATLAKLRREPVIPRIWHQGAKVRDGFNTMTRELGLERRLRCVGLAPRTEVECLDNQGSQRGGLWSLLRRECARRGCIFTGGHNMSWAHRDADVDELLGIYAAVLRRAAGAGKVPAWARDTAGEPVRRKA